ncbi:MAG: phosphoribosylformylglycinamidine synthase subunit PurS [Candidatus Thermoplasmatota archaeon]
MFEVKITVQLKKGVSDPEGTNTLKALHLLGFDQVQSVKTLRTYDIVINDADKNKVKKDAEQMCQRLLTNPVIHSYVIDVKEL